MQITPRAVEQIKKFLNQEDASKVFRISVTSGGCNGFSYKTEISSSDPRDISINDRIVTDSISFNLLANAILDYKDDISFAGFTFENPGASSSCGCGMSFDI